MTLKYFYYLSLLTVAGACILLLCYGVNGTHSENVKTQKSVTNNFPSSSLGKDYSERADVNVVLAQLRTRYSSFSTYKVEALTEQIRTIRGKSAVIESSFRVAYKAPSDLQITWIEDADSTNPKQMLFSIERGAAKLFENGKVKRVFDDPAWGFLTVSSSSNDKPDFEIASVLLNQDRLDRGSSIGILENPMIIGETELFGRSCYVIKGGIPMFEAVSITIWVDKENYLIRGMSRQIAQPKYDHISEKKELYPQIEAY